MKNEGMRFTRGIPRKCNILMRLLLPSVDDTLEVSSLQRSTTDQTTVDVWLSEELRSVASLAATTVED